MSLKVFNIAVNAMHSHAKHIDKISSNIINIDTVGYKKIQGRYKTNYVIKNLEKTIGNSGVNFYSFVEPNSQSTLTNTKRKLDLAVQGKGFLIGSLPNSIINNANLLYTRNGRLKETIINDKRGLIGIVFSNDTSALAYPFDKNNKMILSLSSIKYNKLSKLPHKETSNIDIKANIPFKGLNTNYTINKFIISHVDKEAKVDKEFNLAISLTAQQDSKWVLDVACDNMKQANITPKNILFKSNGSLVIDNNFDGNVKLELILKNGTKQLINLNLSSLTQYYDTEMKIEKITHNGSKSGKFSSIKIEQDGIIRALFDNGKSKPLYKLALANFSSSNNLNIQSNNMYSASVKSGLPIVKPIDGVNKKIMVGYLEDSDVELEAQFSNIIKVQRAYSAAVKTLDVGNKMFSIANGMKN